MVIRRNGVMDISAAGSSTIKVSELNAEKTVETAMVTAN